MFFEILSVSLIVIFFILGMKRGFMYEFFCCFKYILLMFLMKYSYNAIKFLFKLDDNISKDEINNLGGIAISQPLGAWLLTLAAAGMAAAIVAFLLLGSYTRCASVAGQLVPLQGVVTLPAPVTGIVERLDAAEGDAASAEQTLAIIQAPCAMPESGNGGAALEQQIRQQKASLKAAQLRDRKSVV